MTKPAGDHVMTITEPGPDQRDGLGAHASESPLEVLHRLHGKALYRFLLRVTLGDRREAEDLFQETIFRAWRYLQVNPGDAELLRPWLYTVGRRVAIDAARARHARPTEVILTDLGTLPAANDDIDRALIVLTMRSALMSLSADHRRVLVETYYRGRSARETAAVLGIPEGTVKSRLFYALRALATATGQAEAARSSRSRARARSPVG